MDDSKRKLPFDVEIEQALIGALLVDASLMFKHADVIDPEILYDPLHQRIVAQIREFWTDGTSQTPLTIGAALENDEGLRLMGGRPYLNSLAMAAPMRANVRDYCRVLRDLATRRRVIVVAERLIDGAHSAEPGAEIAREGAELLCGIGTDGDMRPPRAMSDVAMDSLKRVERALRGEKVPVVPTGFHKLDEEIGGFMGGDLIVVPGRPGMGKSALGAAFALRPALNGYPVLVFSHEMTASQWADRNVCDLDFDSCYEPEKPLWYESFRKNKLDGSQLERATRAQQRLGSNYDISDDPRLTMEDITARARAFRSKFPAEQMGLIIVDYLQKIPVPFRQGRNREQEVTHVATGSKSLAKQLGWPVVALAQLSRETDKRGEEHRRPTLSDIRESGSIEAEADIVLAPYRPAYYAELRRPGSNAGSAEWAVFNSEYTPIRHSFELLCRKNRHGRTFDLHLWCEIGANAIRDNEPDRFPPSHNAQGLLID